MYSKKKRFQNVIGAKVVIYFEVPIGDNRFIPHMGINILNNDMH